MEAARCMVVQLPARPLPRRWLPSGHTPLIPTGRRVHRGLPRDHRRLRARDAAYAAASTRGALFSAGLHPRDGGEQVLAVGLPAARPRAQAQAQDRARGLAARGREPPSPAVPARPDPLRRLPDREPLQDEAPEWSSGGLRVRAVLLLEPVAGHPRAVLRVLRAARDQVDAV